MLNKPNSIKIEKCVKKLMFSIKHLQHCNIKSYLTLGLGDGCGLADGFGRILRWGFNLIMFCGCEVCIGLANKLLWIICMTGKFGCGVGGLRDGEGDFKLAGDEYGEGG